jgi:hypothetical protein
MKIKEIRRFLEFSFNFSSIFFNDIFNKKSKVATLLSGIIEQMLGPDS